MDEPILLHARPENRHFGKFQRFSTTLLPNALTDANSCIMFPVGEREVQWISRTKQAFTMPTHKALVRMNESGTGGYPLDIVKKTYQLVHNRELFSILQDAVIAQVPTESLDGAYVNDKISGQGKVCLREYVFPKLRVRLNSTTGLNGMRGDVAFRLIGQNGYGGSALKLHGGGFEFFCSNGMMVGEFESVYHKHTRGLVIGDLGKQVEILLKRFVDMGEVWRQWSQKPVTNEQTMKLFRLLANTETLQKKLIDRWAVESEDRGHNAYAAYSALTYYSSHNEGEFAIRGGDEENEHSIMLKREHKVASWLASAEWKEFVSA